MWLTTVNNSDWPSKPGLSTWEAQQELLAILNKVAALKMNAVVFHIRPGGDAMYASRLEPWTQFLTGREGRPPEPAWDPLAFAVTEAHRRGIEVHAWFNPYRAHYTRDSGQAASTHVMRTHPELVRPYGHFIWMDPGEPEVRRRAVRAIVDVVKRYDVDGVHIDDYFYPYPETDSAKQEIDFPDSATYAKYVNRGGTLSKDDWRRHNVDALVEEMFKAVRATKPWVKVGISPFGFWKPGYPEQVRGFDPYAKIYADSKKWLQNGWLDYLAPQLYWPISSSGQPYVPILKWWVEQNTKHRHIWPGLATYRIREQSARHIPANEIIAEIDSTRATPGATGHIHFNMTALMKDADSVDEKLALAYAMPALIPASPWLGVARPGRPTVSLGFERATGERIITMTPTSGARVWLWTVRTLANGVWMTEIIPGTERKHRLGSNAAERVVVTAVNRTGVESQRVDKTIAPLSRPRRTPRNPVGDARAHAASADSLMARLADGVR